MFIVARGIPNSGNAEWAQQWAEGGPNRVYLSHQQVQEDLFGVFAEMTKDMRVAVSEEFHARIEEHLSAGSDVVVAVLGLSSSGLRHYRNIAQRFPGTEFAIKTFDITLEDALARHRASDDAEQNLPERAIHEMHERFVRKPVPEDLAACVID